MNYGGLGYEWYSLPIYSGWDPHYLKCIEGTTSSCTPLNGLRIQHVSQMGTVNIDPLLPQMNITDWRSCMRMFRIILLIIGIIFDSTTSFPQR